MNEKYPNLTKKKLIEAIEEVFNKQDKNEEVFYINEGNGFIPFEKSKTFSKIMK